MVLNFLMGRSAVGKVWRKMKINLWDYCHWGNCDAQFFLEHFYSTKARSSSVCFCLFFYFYFTLSV